MVLTPRRHRLGPVSVALAGAVALAACGGAGGGTDGPGPIVATTSIWADITSGVACGAEVASLVPAGADPHAFEPSLRDRELATSASILIVNGAGLEESTAELVDAAIADGVNVVEMAPHIDLLLTGDDHDDERHDDEDHDDEDHDDEDHDGEDHDDEDRTEGAADAEGPDDDDPHGHGEGGDPHVWHDPRRIAGAIDVIASALEADDLPTCTDAYRAELEALDAEIVDLLAPIPPDRRLLVTDHDSLAYLADRYDFEIVGTVIPSTSTLADASAGQLADLAELIEARAVPAVFTDAYRNSADADALADRLGIAVVPLVTDSLTDAAPTYPALLRTNAAAIAGALAP